jgi:predicted DNA-binding transcriptional regulator YafY
MAGIPVYPQAGRNGGWQLLGGSRTDLSGLTEAEARTLFMVAGPASTATPEAKAALRKLVQALPETFRARAERAASSTVLDPASWGSELVQLPEHLDTLRHAVVVGRQVKLGYSDRTRSESERVVHPLGVVEKGSTWYLVADTDKGLRTFRVSRVRSVEVTDDEVVRPPGFDLATAWQDIVVEVEAKRATVQATVRAPERGVPGLRHAFGPSTKVLGPAPDGESGEPRVDVEVGGPSYWAIASQLTPWLHYIDVLGPPEVRAHLADFGRQLVARFG